MGKPQWPIVVMLLLSAILVGIAARGGKKKLDEWFGKEDDGGRPKLW